MASRALNIDPVKAITSDTTSVAAKWKPDRINWSVDPQTGIIASFSIESVAVQVTFEQAEAGVWTVSFAILEPEGEQTLTLAFHIFNGVMVAIREFLELRDPIALVLHAHDEGLADAYDVYLQREQSQLAVVGYQVETPERMMPLTEFRLRRVVSAGRRL